MKYLFDISILILIITIFSGCTASPPAPKPVEISAGNVTVYLKKDVVAKGENLVFGIINKGDSTIMLRNSAPWYIEREEGGKWKKIFSPVALQVIVPLGYNESREWTWNQNIDKDKAAEPGNYRVVIADEYRVEFRIL